MQSAASLESGKIRFGMFGTARLYAGAQIVADVLERYPGVRVELIGQHSNEVQEQLPRAHLESDRRSSRRHWSSHPDALARLAATSGGLSMAVANVALDPDVAGHTVRR